MVDRTSSEQKPKLTGPKRHHYLPQSYLEGFTRDGLLAVYDREKDEVRVQQPINTGVIGHFYTLEDSEGRKRFELEEMFSELEGKVAPVLKKLAQRKNISGDERSDMAIYVAMATFRTPDIIDSLKAFNSGLVGDMAKQMFSDVEQVKENLRGAPDAPTNESELEKEAKDLVGFAQSDTYHVVTDHKWAVSMAVRMALQIAPILAGRNWLVTHCPHENQSYITSDAPAILTTVTPRENSFYGIGYANEDALVVFPLTHSCLLVIYGSDGGFTHLTANKMQCRHINMALADRCQRFLIGRDAALVRSLAKKLKLAAKKWRPKMQKN